MHALREEVIKGYLHKHPNMFFFPASVIMLLTVSLQGVLSVTVTPQYLFFFVFFVPVREKPKQIRRRNLFC